MSSKSINIIGHCITLIEQRAENLKGINNLELLRFRFYKGVYRDTEILFLDPTGDNPTPRTCRITADRLEKLFGVPVVFILSPGPNYERKRLADKNVYFVMSDKYAFLPMLVAMERPASRKKPTELTPAAQYILLYHLQIRSLNGISAKAIAELLPYSYESVTLGLTCLSDLSLCRKISQASRSKIIEFTYSGLELWQKAQGYFISPVERRIYCDELLSNEHFSACGINALSHYSMLNPDKERWIMMTAKQFRSLNAQEAFINPNEFDGNIIIEVWKYVPVHCLGTDVEYVDKLSLAISLRDNHDPRVEEEVERMINNMEWKD